MRAIHRFRRPTNTSLLCQCAAEIRFCTRAVCHTLRRFAPSRKAMTLRYHIKQTLPLFIGTRWDVNIVSSYYNWVVSCTVMLPCCTKYIIQLLIRVVPHYQYTGMSIATNKHEWCCIDWSDQQPRASMLHTTTVVVCHSCSVHTRIYTTAVVTLD